uniref:Uncharacterized protein n=1 Tax=Octopus bimaculoides TaxID=37653 RepID=A0A0L8I4T2_OCTBM
MEFTQKNDWFFSFVSILRIVCQFLLSNYLPNTPAYADLINYSISSSSGSSSCTLHFRNEFHSIPERYRTYWNFLLLLVPRR